MFASDVIVVGGGLVGTAVAYGLAQPGKNITVLDEGDDAFRASRGNFGLIWVHGKGRGIPQYARWTRAIVSIASLRKSASVCSSLRCAMRRFLRVLSTFRFRRRGCV